MKKEPSCNFNLDTNAPVSHQLVEAFWVLGPAYTRWAESHMSQKNMTPQRIRLLSLLFKEGPIPMSKLGEEMGVSKTNITVLVDALEKDRMVSRKAHPTDRRSTLIAITPKARERMSKGCAEFKDRVSRLFSAFPAQEQKHLLQMLWKVKDALVKRGILTETCQSFRSQKSH